MTIASDSLGAMPPLSSPLRSVLVAFAGWMNQQQRDVIDYLQEESRALRNQGSGSGTRSVATLRSCTGRLEARPQGVVD
jgi:hypothetical protein